MHVLDVLKHLPSDTIEKCGFKDGQLSCSGWQAICGSTGTAATLPDWVTKGKCYSQFGMLMDVMTRRILFDLCLTHNVGLATTEVYETGEWASKTNQICRDVFKGFKSIGKLPAESTLTRTLELEKMAAWLESELFLRSEVCPRVMALAPELNCDLLTGHPDLVFDSCVLDIKTTKNFRGMAPKAMAQVLAYYSIMKAKDIPVTHIGFLLPLQQQIWIYEVFGFDWPAYLQKMLGIANSPLNPVYNHRINTLALALISASGPYSAADLVFRTMGNHIKKEKGQLLFSLTQYLGFLSTISSRLAPIACQAFLHPNRNGNIGKMTNTDLVASKKYISDHSILYHTHTPYLINLCHPTTSKRTKEKDPFEWCLGVVKEDLSWTSQVGGKGVIIHTGKCKKMDMKTAVTKMREFVVHLLLHATKECPLLLETGAGQHTEILCDAKSLAAFYRCIPKELRDRFGICVDTCHVFAAGHDPFEYITEFTKLTQNSAQQVGQSLAIRLVHFNNSRAAKGSCKDQHAGIMSGQIPISSLFNVARWAKDVGVPLVRE
jgi:endonuclease IV